MNADDAARLMGVPTEQAVQILREWRSRPLLKVARCREGHAIFRLYAVDSVHVLFDSGDVVALLPRATLAETPFTWSGYAGRCAAGCRPTTWVTGAELAAELAKNRPGAPLTLL